MKYIVVSKKSGSQMLILSNGYESHAVCANMDEVVETIAHWGSEWGFGADDFSVYELGSTAIGVDAVDSYETETCCECGNSTVMGSGRFINRIPECSGAVERAIGGRPHPLGGWVCAECEAEIEAEFEAENQD